jgi:hypothetical protein
MTKVLPWNLRIYGKAWAKISALSRGAMWATEDDEAVTAGLVGVRVVVRVESVMVESWH